MVKDDNWQIWQIYPPELTSSGHGWQLADQLADLPPQVHICSGQEWQFNNSIVSYRQINWQIYPPEPTPSGQGWQLADQLADLPLPRYTYAVAKNGNLTFLLSHIDRSTGRSTPQN